MDRALVLTHLTQAERHVSDGTALLARQRTLILRLRLLGYDTATAENLLQLFNETQDMHIADRDRLRAELEACT